MKNFYIIVFFLAIIQSMFAANEPKPDWISAVPSDSKIFYAVGLAQYKPGQAKKAIESARADALNNISTYIVADVKSVFSQQTTSATNNKEENFEDIVKKELSVRSDVVLSGVKFDGMYDDKKAKTYYVLASIEKTKVKEIIRQTVDPVGFELEKIFSEIQRSNPVIKSLTISNFNFKGKHYSGEISSYLRSKIASTFTNLGTIEEYSDPDFNKYLEQSGLSTRGITIEENDEQDILYQKVQGFITGSYWENNDKLEFEIKIYDLKQKKYTISKNFTVPKDKFSNIKLIPDNIDDFQKKYSELSDMFASQNFNIKIWPDKGDFATYKQGEYLVPYFISNKDCYLRVYLVSADGSSVLLFPNYFDKNNFVKKNEVYKIGDPKFSPFKLKLSPPYGSEMLIAIASTSDFADKLNHTSEIPTFDGNSLRGVIIESVKNVKSEMVSQATCTYTIIP